MLMCLFILFHCCADAPVESELGKTTIMRQSNDYTNTTTTATTINDNHICTYTQTCVCIQYT